jgi:hypothetical protein
MRSHVAGTLSLAALVVAVTLLVLSGGSERATGQPPPGSWPSLIDCPTTPPGISALSRLEQLHEQALSELSVCQPSDPRIADLVLILNRSFVCASWDGVHPGNAHHGTGHTGAITAVWNAYQRIFTTTGTLKPNLTATDWRNCATALNHTHDHAAGNPTGQPWWPHAIPCPAQATENAGMRLKQLHDAAVAALATCPSTGVPPLVSVVQRTFQCAAWDGTHPGHPFHGPGSEPPPPTPHEGAVSALWTAYLEVFDQNGNPLANQDWQASATGLNHGHP